MNLRITSRKFKAKDSTKEFIHAELAQLEKITDEIMDVDVILSFDNTKESAESIKTAEIVVQIPGKVLTATESSDDFGKSVSAAVLKIEKQLAKVKSKKIDSKRVEKITTE
ncbi:MAG: ribosome hibernation-promoting factor, HPF/YfiA family [Bacteroidota bacterium]